VRTDPTVTVAPATERDWAEVRDVRLDALADDPGAFCAVLEAERQLDEAAWRRRVTAADTTWLLARTVADGEAASSVVGVVAVATVDASTVDLVAFWVRPAGRGRGTGSALIEAVCDLARERGHARVTLEVGDHNTPAQRLYARHGFVPTGRTSTMPPPKEHVTEHQLAREL
jgi:ribosomal protein S18 acetylase RimI-like enzyme